jgi:selenocysteine lyase/cysteine desulfurase
MTAHPSGADAAGSAALRAAYGRFLAPGKILLTGHSHQAWPDAVRDALVRCFDDAAAFADDKWSAVVMPKVEAVGAGVLERMGFDRGDPIAFGKSTHELVYRLITCLPPPAARPRIVTTTSEFHSLRRQLTRLAEEGADVVWVDAHPREGLAERVLEALTPGTAMLAISAVIYEDAYVVPRLGEILERAAEIGAIPLVDAYHAFNVVPVAWGPAKEKLFVTSGGYKYAAFGEGVSWLRFPRACALRPVYTGWFADFGGLSSGRAGEVSYGEGGARFSGATFDPSSIYRAEAALEHWDRFGLTVEALRAISLRQTGRVIARLDAAGEGARLLTAREDARRGGFVTVRVERASDAVGRLRERGVLVDSRGSLLRIGPAPYLTDDEIDRGVDTIVDVIRLLER